MRRAVALAVLAVPALLLTAAPTPEPAWTMFGGTPARNQVGTTATALSPEFPVDPDDQQVRVLGSRVLWKAQLGSRSYTQPVVVGDRVLIGTNNENPRNPRDRDRPTEDYPQGPPRDKGILLCLRRSDGGFLWQMVHDKLPIGQVSDWPREGMCSTPTVEGDRAYYTSNLCEVVCLDLNGFADGNDGVQTETYRDKTDGDVVWSYDMIRELKVFPHNMSVSSPVIVGDLLFVCTGNGVNENHIEVPSPDAPSFICLNKKTGRLVWQSNLPGRNIMHGQWSSAAYGVIGGVPQVIFPAGDGWLYAFDPPTGRLLWKFAGNPKDAVYELGGKGSASDFIAMPVIYKDKVYIGMGQDPEHGDGVGHLWCIDPAGRTGDISPELVTNAKANPPRTRPNPNSGAVWHLGGKETRPYAKRDYVFGRTMSTACIVDDILYIGELAGYVRCVDARTGKPYWQWDARTNIWGSCHFAGGRVVVGSEDGDLFFFKHEKAPEVIDEVGAGSAAAVVAERKATAAGLPLADARMAGRRAYDTAVAGVRQRVRERYLLQRVEIGQPMRSTPTMVGDVLYVSTESSLYAIKAK